MENRNEEWVSASTLAKRLGVSQQTIYNYLKQGKYEYQTFDRGVMRGLLIKVKV